MWWAASLDPAKCQITGLKDKFELFQNSEKILKRLKMKKDKNMETDTGDPKHSIRISEEGEKHTPC